MVLTITAFKMKGMVIDIICTLWPINSGENTGVYTIHHMETTFVPEIRKHTKSCGCGLIYLVNDPKYDNKHGNSSDKNEVDG